MFIAAIICTFILTCWIIMNIRNEVLKEVPEWVFHPMTSIVSACITFLLVYYNVI